MRRTVKRPDIKLEGPASRLVNQGNADCLGT